MQGIGSRMCQMASRTSTMQYNPIHLCDRILQLYNHVPAIVICSLFAPLKDVGYILTCDCKVQAKGSPVFYFRVSDSKILMIKHCYIWPHHNLIFKSIFQDCYEGSQ